MIRSVEAGAVRTTRTRSVQPVPAGWMARVAAFCLAVLLSAVTLTGCAAAAPELNAAAATRLQTSVAAVTNAAAANQVQLAVAALDRLQAQLREATASGSVSAARAGRIQACIDLVRADLVAALPATGTPTPSESGNSDTSPPAAPPASSAPPSTAPSTEPTPTPTSTAPSSPAPSVAPSTAPTNPPASPPATQAAGDQGDSDTADGAGTG